MRYRYGKNTKLLVQLGRAEMSIKAELDNIVRLEEEGFEETGEPCPKCGTFLWECVSIFGDDDQDDPLMETSSECPHCGHSTVSYD